MIYEIKIKIEKRREKTKRERDRRYQVVFSQLSVGYGRSDPLLSLPRQGINSLPLVCLSYTTSEKHIIMHHKMERFCLCEFN